MIDLDTNPLSVCADPVVIVDDLLQDAGLATAASSADHDFHGPPHASQLSPAWRVGLSVMYIVQSWPALSVNTCKISSYSHLNIIIIIIIIIINGLQSNVTSRL